MTTTLDDALTGAPIAAPAVTRPEGPRWHRVVHRLAEKLNRLLIVLLVALVVAIVAMVVTGRRPLVVRSGSMEPTLMTGDLVIVENVRSGDVRVGDIITFQDRTRNNELVTHRVVTVRPVEGGQLEVETRGDANGAGEQWFIGSERSVGRYVFRLPGVGRVLAAVGSPLVRLGFFFVVLAVLGSFGLRRIFRATPKQTNS